MNGLNTDEAENNLLFLDFLNDNFDFLEMSHEENMNKKSSFEIPEIHNIRIMKGEQGFGFTIAESNLWGQKVKKILDHQCCKNLMEGDILLSINSIDIKNLTHSEVVQVLKECPKNKETILRVQRGLTRSSLKRSKADNVPMVLNGKLNLNGFRSKTPTADIYSTQQKEILPIRPKTPIIDIRSRVQMKSPILNDLNNDDIELDSKLIIDDNKSTISTATTAYDTTKLLSEQFNDQRSDTYTATDSIISKTSARNRFFSPLDIKNGNDNGNYIYPNSNHSFSLLPGSQRGFIQSPSTTSYQPHQNNFFYDNQNFRMKQTQQSEFPSSSNIVDNYSMLQNQFNLPPQMSNNIGQRINNYLMDRKRSTSNSEVYWEKLRHILFNNT